MAKKCISKILWPVDPYELESAIQKSAAEALNGFLAASQAELEPVYILNPRQLDLGLDAPEQWLEQYRPVAEGALKSFLEGRVVSSLSGNPWKFKVLVQASASNSAAVKTLNHHVNATGAEMIFLGTHGRKGMPRLFLGSFAETLLLESKIPVLVVNSKTKSVAHYDHILFATDLSRTSWNGFRKTLALASQLGSRVTIFHSIQNPSKSSFHGESLMGATWIPMPAFVEEELIARRKVAERWLKTGLKMGVAVDIDLELTHQGIVPAILHAADRDKTSIIAMTAQSGPLASAVMGSVTRQIVREATKPIWVVRASSAKG